MIVDDDGNAKKLTGAVFASRKPLSCKTPGAAAFKGWTSRVKRFMLCGIPLTLTTGEAARGFAQHDGLDQPGAAGRQRR